MLLPVFNAAAYVEAAVRSVLRQTFRDFELLIVDDGSADSGLEILRKMELEDNRIHVVSRPNKGLVATLNELVALARGPYVARMDADDICVPHRLERQYEYLERNPDCVAVGARCLLIDSEDLPICEFMDEATHSEIDSALLSPRLGMIHPSVMMRTETVRRAGGYRLGYPHVEDLDLFLRLGEIGNLANLQEVLLAYRVHQSSVSHSHTVEQSEGALKAVQAARLRRGLAPVAHVAPLRSAGETKAELHRKWSWWALNAGNLHTSRKHARLAIKCDRSVRANFRLCACLLRDTLRHFR